MIPVVLWACYPVIYAVLPSTTKFQFAGLQYGYTSYMAYPKIKDGNFDLEMEFKFTLTNHSSANISDTLLIYTGQKSGTFL